MRDEDAWFAPKRFGLGFRPVRWPGWLLTIGYAATVIGLTHAPIRPDWLRLVLIATLSAGFLIVAIRTSRGGLGWRWNGIGR